MESKEILKGLEENRDPGVAICKQFLSDRGLKFSDNPETILARCFSEARSTRAPEAEYVLATLLWTGVLGTIDREAAVKWCSQAADSSYLPAITMLAGLYQRGAPGIAKDVTLAIQLLEKAAEAKYAPALGYLATAYMHGLGVSEDHEVGLSYMRRAAAAGDILSQMGLGSQLTESKEISEISEGMRWLQAAAGLGLPSAHNLLAEIFTSGLRGVPPDQHRAEYHRRLALTTEDE